MRSEPPLLNGRYKLLLRLGQGGQASVWLGEDTLIERRVALKQLVTGNGDDSAMRARAVAEARAMARVRHPVIVPIHDIIFAVQDPRTGDFTEADPATGDPWLVMEFIEGATLGSLIDRQSGGAPLGDTAAARIGLAVLDGLDAVHRAEIVHRDVKPDNILVAGDPADPGCSVFLVDFGIAKIGGSMSVTHPHHVVGTPLFIAPERLLNGDPGPASDLYSLGVTLFCAIDGAPPFRPPDGEFRAEALRYAIMHDQPRAIRRPSELADVIYRLLVKDPGQRVRSDEARRELTAALRRIEAAGRPPIRTPTVPSAGSEHRPRERHKSRTIRLDKTPPSGKPPKAQASPGTRPRVRVDDVRDLILGVGTDAGVAMLLSIPREDTASILANCPERAGADLLAGIAADRPVAASAIMGMLSTVAAARLLKQMRGEASGTILRGMSTRAAVRILDKADSRTAAVAVKQVKQASDHDAARLLRGMTAARAASVVVKIKPDTAAEIFSADPALRTSVLPFIPEPERGFITRFLKPGSA